MVDLSKLTNEEIKEKITKMKTALDNATTKPYFDKYTKIDDLLRKNIAISIETNERLQLIAQLLYAQYLSEGGQPKTQAEISQLPISKILSDDYKTENKVFNNLSISGNKEVFNVLGSGYIDVIKIVSSTSSTDNKTYSVRIRCNDDIIYQNSWTELEARTPNERGMVAFENDISSEYILIFRTILYTESFNLDIYDSSATFDQIQIKYHRRV